MRKFEIASEFGPSGDQENAIKLLSENLASGMKGQTLLGVTGSGKTFTIAKVIEKIQKPTLVLSHNKTLAAQLYREFKDFFPNNAVEYFVSYYDYYQPEAYVASRDLYIEKDADINEEIDMMRLAATSALMSRDDVIIVATVSCIYGLGNPEDYKKLSVKIRKDGRLDRDDLIRRLVGIQYDREDAALERGKFRVRGDLVDIYPAYAKSGFRIGFFGDTVEGIYALDILNNKVIEELDKITIFPAKHFVTTRDTVLRTIPFIKEELDERVKFFTSQNKELEARRIQAKTEYDMDMLLEVGYCKGIENYSRFFAQRKRGERPSTLIDFFPEGFLTVIDESHATIPQIGGMYEGDKARKTSLVDYGFRLP
ncbi:MAG TPA: DEAD/DEAH box helicase family protein, partial [Spirochaetota bacterium]|nr:DEAD/DEAH box helicase family protein [Spirochaetota bacterium]